ncbi:membrane protein [Sulfurifustis variabilis]|uniref:Membrane protein n=1 Tax=Sulfurifustis variabilis TaxID=1675686 RepID=A0A1B4V0G4_9GAMM|nr:EamA family transporter [Sulfurifustis variabilis]BAU46929.1 membrane protein [Sulfurifustis variabilis]
MIPAPALLALAASVLMHVAWNLSARAADPKSFFLWWALLGWLVLVGPWSAAWLIGHAEWSARLALLLSVTCAAEALYFLALGIAYRHAPVPLVYPIARSSPVLIAVWTVFLFGEHLPAAGWLAILVIVGGVLGLAWTARGGAPAQALPWAIAAAFGTSVYSTSNKLAVPALPGYLTQLGYVTVTLLVAWIALTLELRARTGRWVPEHRPASGRAVLGGLFIGNAYALVIFAMQYVPAAYAVAFTNAGIVLATLIAITIYKEREHWRSRLAAVLVICAGLLLLGLA